jgi:O-methyltransferase involved in polyketide biosynthesis
MPEKRSYLLKNVSRTLILPLWGRAVEQDKQAPLIRDPVAKRLMGEIDFDYSVFNDKWDRGNQIAWAARAWNVDRTVKGFQTRHEFDERTIVNLGCGLDTVFERNDDGSTLWREVDLPEVIEYRGRFLRENDRRRFIAGSAFSTDTLGQIDGRGSILFIAAGLLYYFDETRVLGFFRDLAAGFPQAEILFDVCSPLGVKVANKRVISAHSIEKTAVLQWSVKRANDRRAFGPAVRIIESYPLFRKVMGRIERPLRMTARISDFLRIMSMVHAEVGKA